ncbi:MAG: PAS domain-containing sensor histidine kinase [Thermodesulfobacteriota bacterium]
MFDLKFQNPFDRVSFKMVFSTLSVLLVVALVFFYLFYDFHRRQLIEELKSHISRISEMVGVSLEESMLEGKSQNIQKVVEDLSSKEGVEGIQIMNKDGVVKVSSTRELIGKTLDQETPTCKICHRRRPLDRGQTVIFQREDSSQVLRYVSPIRNKPRCQRCHLPTERLNGILIMDFSMSEINSQLAANRKWMMIWAVIMVVAVGGVISLLINRLVLKKVRKLERISKRIGEGRLDEKIEIKGKDEMSNLALHLNRMTANLKESIREKENQRNYLENVINSIGDGLIVLDKNYTIVIANRSYAAYFNRTKEEIMGKSCFAISHRSDIPCHRMSLPCPVRKTFERGSLSKAVHVLRDGNGNERHIEIYSAPFRGHKGEVVQAIEILRDITERKEMEDRLIHSERLASLGILASGLSHEINNPLASISTSLGGLQRRMANFSPSDPEFIGVLGKYMGLIQGEVARCKGILERLLHLSSKSPSPSGKVDINQAIRDTVSLMEYDVQKNGIRISTDLEPGVPPLPGDESQIRQVILNMVLNGVQAIGGHGTLSIITRRVRDNVSIRFVDTGCGIRKEDLKRIFEPFFSRRPSGKGTGLGLSICESIVRRHGGEILVESSVGQGTEFEVRLPISDHQAQGEV